jgi:hypothetical protein
VASPQRAAVHAAPEATITSPKRVRRRERIGPLSDPAVRHERASRAGRARTGTDYYIRKLVENANGLTAEQAELVRQLLPSGSP